MRTLEQAAQGAKDVQALLICRIWLVYRQDNTAWMHTSEASAREEYRTRAANNETVYLCFGNGDPPLYSLAECPRCGNTFDHRFPCVQS